jgi:6-phosphogluconate dehydrogenase
MNPKTLKSVYKQINKEELKSEKIELALIDDLKQIQKESTKAYVDYIDDMDTSKGYLSQAKKKATKAVQLLKESVNLYEDVESKFKELGIDVPSELKKQTPKAALAEAEKDLNMMTSLFSQFKVR